MKFSRYKSSLVSYINYPHLLKDSNKKPTHPQFIFSISLPQTHPIKQFTLFILKIINPYPLLGMVCRRLTEKKNQMLACKTSP